MILEDEAIALRHTAEAIERNSVGLSQTGVMLDYLTEGNYRAVSIAVQLKIAEDSEGRDVVEFFRIDDKPENDEQEIAVIQALSIEILKRSSALLERRENCLKKRLFDIIEQGEVHD